ADDFLLLPAAKGDPRPGVERRLRGLERQQAAGRGADAAGALRRRPGRLRAGPAHLPAPRPPRPALALHGGVAPIPPLPASCPDGLKNRPTSSESSALPLLAFGAA